MEVKQRSSAAAAASGRAASLLLPAAAVAVACLAAVCAGESEAATVAAVYVFGDSLVDVGNNGFLPPPAPRAEFPCGVDLPGGAAGGRTGRFTNGYNLADIIAQRVGFNMSPPAYLSLTPETSVDLVNGRVGANYASGGSGILDSTGNGAITLREQVQLFADTKASMLAAGEHSRRRLVDRRLSESLFLASAGNNDFNAFVDGRATMSDAPAFIAHMVSAYVKHIRALYRLGARRVALLDALPIGCLPSTRKDGDDGACDGVANSLARRFNGLLRSEMAAAAAASMPGLRYSVASVYGVFSDMIADPRLAGLQEASSACCGGGGRFNAEADCSAVASSTLCADRGEYVFWDKVHGTEAAYRHAVVAFFGPAERRRRRKRRYTEPIDFTELVLVREQSAPQDAMVDLDGKKSYATRVSRSQQLTARPSPAGYTW